MKAARLINMGGPANPGEVSQFTDNLFMKLPALLIEEDWS